MMSNLPLLYTLLYLSMSYDVQSTTIVHTTWACPMMSNLPSLYTLLYLSMSYDVQSIIIVHTIIPGDVLCCPIYHNCTHYYTWACPMMSNLPSLYTLLYLGMSYDVQSTIIVHTTWACPMMSNPPSLYTLPGHVL